MIFLHVTIKGCEPLNPPDDNSIYVDKILTVKYCRHSQGKRIVQSWNDVLAYSSAACFKHRSSIEPVIRTASY